MLWAGAGCADAEKLCMTYLHEVSVKAFVEYRIVGVLLPCDQIVIAHSCPLLHGTRMTDAGIENHGITQIIDHSTSGVAASLTFFI